MPRLNLKPGCVIGIAFLCVFAAALLAGLLWLANIKVIPTDEQLIARFHERRPQLDRIVAMVQQDRGSVKNIAPTFVHDGPEGSLSPARVAEYRQLLRRVGDGTTLSERYDGTRHWIEFRVCTWGNTDVKGYLFGEPPPDWQTTAHLGSGYWSSAGYRPLEGKWGLYLRRYGG